MLKKHLFPLIVALCTLLPTLPTYTEELIIDQYLDIFDEKSSNTPVGTLRPQKINILTAEGDWVQISTWLGSKWINLSLLPQALLLDVPIYNQRELGLISGCEIVSTAMMINYIKPVSVEEIVSKMPLSDDNPEEGYVGDVKVLASGWTIFPPALAPLVKEYLGSAQDMTNCSIDDLKLKLAEDKPIVVWLETNRFDVHAVCLTGYDENGFFYNDPWTAEKDAYFTYRAFYKMWDSTFQQYSGKRAISF